MRSMHYLIYICYLLLIIFLIFFDRKKPMQRLSWILVLIFLPGIGLLLYWFIGSTNLLYYRKEKIRKRHGDVFNELDEIVMENGHGFEVPLSRGAQFHQKYCGSVFTTDNEAEIYTTGAPKYKQLFADIEAATDHIHVQYFTIHNDGTGRKLIDTLIEKVNQGLEVKLLYDTLGCLPTFIMPELWRLRKAGGSVISIRPYTRAINYRNHRKIVIIDGKIGYVGGMNMGDQYTYGVKGMHWRDTHLRLTGSVVHSIQRVFLSDWTASTRRQDIGLRHELRHYFPVPDAPGNLKAQIIASGLHGRTYGEEIVNLSYFNLIGQAKKRVWIQTPYFRPPETMVHVLKTLAILGVDVRIMISNSYASGDLFNHSTNNYFLRHVVGSGVRVFLYKDIMHAKTMLIDDDILCIGTVNLNNRSLEIDDEVYAYFESKSLNKEYEGIFGRDLANSRELDYLKFEKQNLISRAMESVASFLTPFS